MDPDRIELTINTLVAGLTALAVALTALGVAVAKLAAAGRTLRAVIRGVELGGDDAVKAAIKGEAEGLKVQAKLAPLVQRETKRLEAEKAEEGA